MEEEQPAVTALMAAGQAASLKEEPPVVSFTAVRVNGGGGRCKASWTPEIGGRSWELEWL